MSLFLFVIGVLLFAGGAFCLYSGLYSGNNGAGEFAQVLREALSKYLSDPKTVLVLLGAFLAASGVALVLIGGLIARKERKSRAAVSVRVLTVLAMLLAMTIMLDRFPGLSVKTPGWKIGFSFIPPMLAAMLYGPVEAAIVYGLSDLVGATLFPFGPYHPGFTVVAALMGFVMGLFLNRRPFAFARGKAEWKKLRFFPNFVMPVLINCLLLGLVVNTLWVSQLYGSKTYWGWFVYRLVEYAILVPVQLVLSPAIEKLCGRIKRTGMTGGRAAERLKAISRSESILGLARVTELLSLMGRPQDAVRVIHVAGTNGKGSFVAFVSSILKEAGFKVGSFTSPALTGPCDSLRINGERIGDERLGELFSKVGEYSAKMKEKPTEFEALTAAAFEYFREENCDIAVVECGLGGGGDATNVMASPLLSVITNVELDHTDRLGSTVSEIARNKAGIIKQGRPVLWGGRSAEAGVEIAARAKETGSALYRTDFGRLSVVSESLDGTDIEFDGFGKLRISLLGSYQPENAANALTAVEILRALGIDIPDAAVRRGMENAVWPARFELLCRDPAVIYDGAHNPAGMELAAEGIKKLFPGTRVALLIGVMADKDHAKYPAMLKEIVGRAFCVAPDNPRSLDAKTLCSEFVSSGVFAEAYSSFEDGVRAAYEYAKREGVPLAALGTLYMYGQFGKALDKIE